jgi:hypothetical protein
MVADTVNDKNEENLLWFHAKIRSLDGQLIATGPITLPSDRTPDWFAPDWTLNAENIQNCSEVLATVNGETFHLVEWEACEKALKGFPHFHFRIAN